MALLFFLVANVSRAKVLGHQSDLPQLVSSSRSLPLVLVLATVRPLFWRSRDLLGLDVGQRLGLGNVDGKG